MFKKILLVLLVLIGGFAIYVAMQPADFSVSRSTVIAASPQRVFDQVNDFENWKNWSPWYKMEPAASKVGTPSAGKGAIMTWDGKEVGAGKIEIIESKPAEVLRMKIDFSRPFEATNATLFTFEPDGEKTKVTWTMSGTNSFIGKAICAVMNMDKAVGGDFEKGLAEMKKTAETPEKQADTPKADTPKEK